MDDETMTLWVRLRGEEKERATILRDREKRSYASLIRIALAQYWDTQQQQQDSAA